MKTEANKSVQTTAMTPPSSTKRGAPLSDLSFGQKNLPVKHDPAAKAALLETVNNQITGDEAPEVRTEYNRLLRIGYTEKEARETIAFVLGCHIVATLRTKVPFNYADYLSDLKQLPDCDMDRHFEK